MSASATAPPAPHNKLSRLPWIHRVTLECHTNREYAQKQKIVTTHFFGRFSYLPLRILPISPPSTVPARYCVGDLPESLLKTRLNCESD